MSWEISTSAQTLYSSSRLSCPSGNKFGLMSGFQDDSFIPGIKSYIEQFILKNVQLLG